MFNLFLMPLSKERLDNFKNKLEKEKASLEAELKELNPDKLPDFGSDVDHFDEEADEAEELTTNVSIANAIKERLGDIDSSLRKIGLGTYGNCEECGKEIDMDVLEASPESRLCKNCKHGQKSI